MSVETRVAPAPARDLGREAGERAAGGDRLRLLLVGNPVYAAGTAHGGNLRLYGCARELVAAGHEVCLVVRRRPTDDPEVKAKCLEGLKADGVITDHFEIEYRRPRLRGKLARLLFHPALGNLLLGGAQAEAASSLGEIIKTKRADACVFSARDLLFMLPAVRKTAGAVVDWVDSYFLYHFREARLYFRERRFLSALGSLRAMAEAFVEERYYGRQADFNLAVSPVDKSYLDRATGRPGRNGVLPNGVEAREAVPCEKVRGRIIFTGMMDFPPNYKSALWFIDEVFPLLRGRGVRLVIAGGNPVEELRARAGEDIEVTGFVEDIRREIARSELYVAPLVCGGGFKNKVVEAVSAGTFVAGTSMAVEFLGPGARRHLLVADEPRALADAILAYLHEPQKYAPDLEALTRIIREELTWAAAAKGLAAVAREAANERAAASPRGVGR
ncbi:MAG TPA: glycosyltransferase family 4 protein [Pyrinomonadaceae bacterium]|nr:glycosyltransferase family 4 protein [Pyrinomonadaceae bacterium]